MKNINQNHRNEWVKDPEVRPTKSINRLANPEKVEVRA